MAQEKAVFFPSKEEKMSAMDFVTQALAGATLLSPFMAVALITLVKREAGLSQKEKQ